MFQMRNKILKEAMTLAQIDKDDVALANTYISELSSVNNKNIEEMLKLILYMLFQKVFVENV